MKSYRLLKAIKIAMFAVVGSLAFGYVLMRLWNWLMPGIFHVGAITFWQALGLFVLSKILFGGFHRHGGGGGRGWKRHMEERWARMTPDERERFRAGMRGRGGRWCRPRPEAEAEQGAR